MESPLDVLTKAANYVENQQQENGVEASKAAVVTPAAREVRSRVTENGDTGHVAISYQSGSSRVEESHHLKDKTSLIKSVTDERRFLAGDQNIMRDRGSGDETPMTHYGHSNGVLHQRVYQDERHLPAPHRNSSVDSPTRSVSPVGKRTHSPVSTTDNEQQQRPPLALPQLPPMSGVGAHPMAHIVPSNPMLPFVHPLMYSAAFDPNLCADAARAGLLLNSELDRQHSPGSSPNAVTSTAAVAHAASIPGFMYPTLATNPAYFMGARGAQAPGLSLADVPMLLPPQLAAYGAAANLLPGQFPALSEQDKRFYENLQGFSQHAVTSAQFLAHPYLKSFATAGLDATSGKGTPPHVPVTAGVGVPGMPQYSVEFLLKYQEALTNEALKKSVLSPQSAASPAPKRASPPPDTSKKGSLHHAYPFSIPYHSATAKSPGPDARKLSAPMARPVKNGSAGPSPHLDHARAAREREIAYADNQDFDEAGRRLIALAQRPRKSVPDVYPSPYKGPHDRVDRRSPSPYQDQHDNLRRGSRDRSPVRLSTAGKPAKKRSHENFASGRDLTEPKTRSPGLSSQLNGSRSTKSPLPSQQHRRSNSPLPGMSQRRSQAGNSFLSVPGSKTSLGLAEKDNPAYLTPTPPYMFSQALGGYPAPPGYLHSYLRQAEAATSSAGKSAICGMPGAFSTATSSPLYRQPVPSEAALNEYARLTGIPPYAAIALLMPQQQALRPSVIAHSTASQGMLDRSDKERDSPVVNSTHHHPHHGATSKLPTRNSPSPAHPKPAKQPFSLAYPYGAYANARTPPVYADDDAEVRHIKREASPCAAKGLNFSKGSDGALRASEDERSHRSLKRKSEDPEDAERHFGIEAVTKRKREVNADANAPDIEEHFRRSLGEKYRKEPDNKVSITGSVDDHFQKALGDDVWSRLKPSNKPNSPDSVDGLDRGDTYRPETLSSASSVATWYRYQNYLQQQQQANDGRHVTAALPYQSPSKTSLGGKMVKARGIVYPEATAEAAAAPPAATRTYSSSSSVRSERSSPSNKSDFDARNRNSLYPTSNGAASTYRAESPLPRDAKPPTCAASTLMEPSYHDGTIDRPQPISLARTSPTSHAKGSTPVPPYTIAPPSYSTSPPRNPPTYSPQSSTSSNAAKSSPSRHPSMDSRSPAEPGITVPVSV